MGGWTRDPWTGGEGVAQTRGGIRQMRIGSDTEEICAISSKKLGSKPRSNIALIIWLTISEAGTLAAPSADPKPGVPDGCTLLAPSRQI